MHKTDLKMILRRQRMRLLGNCKRLDDVGCVSEERENYIAAVSMSEPLFSSWLIDYYTRLPLPRSTPAKPSEVLYYPHICRPVYPSDSRPSDPRSYSQQATGPEENSLFRVLMHVNNPPKLPGHLCTLAGRPGTLGLDQPLNSTSSRERKLRENKYPPSQHSRHLPPVCPARANVGLLRMT